MHLTDADGKRYFKGGLAAASGWFRDSVTANVVNVQALDVAREARVADITFSKALRSTPDAAKDKAEILNDTAGLKKLMIVGNKSAGAERRVGVMDRLDVHGSMGVSGDATFDTSINVNGKLFLRDRALATSPSGTNNSDPYFLEKVTEAGNRSSLRMTINDDADEGFEIWGDSCRVGNCSGPGALRHRFGADGSVSHTGKLVASGLQSRNPDWNWLHVHRDAGDQLFFGGDAANRGIWSEGSRPVTVYTQGQPRLTVEGDGSAVRANTSMVVAGGLKVKDDIQFTGGNNWILHTPDDGRQTMYIANMKNGNWDWSKQVTIDPTGDVTAQGGVVSNSRLCVGDVCLTRDDLLKVKAMR
jgi:hypothetical protein